MDKNEYEEAGARLLGRLYRLVSTVIGFVYLGVLRGAALCILLLFSVILPAALIIIHGGLLFFFVRYIADLLGGAGNALGFVAAIFLGGPALYWWTSTSLKSVQASWKMLREGLGI
jgi:hypothetical protein